MSPSLTNYRLHALIPWQQLLPLLGAPAHNQPLPAQVTCPLCLQEQLYLYHNTTISGTWHYCRSCGSHGDMLTLAQRKWDTSLLDSLVRLDRLGIDLPPHAVTANAVESYTYNYVNPREAYEKLLATAQTGLSEMDETLRSLLRQLKLREVTDRSIWRQRLGRYLGATHNHTVQEYLQPYRVVTSDKGKQLRGGNKIFKGRDWGQVLVIPLYTLPRFVSGFLFVGRSAKEEDIVFQPTPRALGQLFPTNTDRCESGLCMYDTLLEDTASEFGDTVFVFDNPLLAFAVQAKWCRGNTVPAPIISAYTGRHTSPSDNVYRVSAYDVWASMPPRHYVFWNKKPTASLFNMASRVGGDVTSSAVASSHTHRSSDLWLRRIRQSAKHWQVALDELLQSLPVNEAEILYRGLDLPPDALEAFLRGCSAQVRNLAERLPQRMSVTTSVTVRNKQIVEGHSGWYIQKTGESISNARLVVDNVVYQEDTQCSWYEGRILLGDASVPFFERDHVVEHDTFAWMRQQLLAADAGLVRAAKSWSRDAVNIAMQFHAPDTVRDTLRVGWDPPSATFRLPRFTVKVGEPPREMNLPRLDPAAPAVRLQPPGWEQPNWEELTYDNDTQQLFWAITAAIAANILAPAINEKPTGIGLFGTNVRDIGQLVASAHGCVCCDPQGGKAAAAEQLLADHAGTHGWPTYVRLDASKWRTPRWRQWLQDMPIKNTVINITETLVQPLAAFGDWRFVGGEQAQLYSHQLGKLGAAVLPYWLADICRRKLELQADAPDLARRVLYDFAELARDHGDADMIRGAGSWLHDCLPQTAASSLAHVIYQLICEGKLALVRAGYETKRAGEAVYHLPDHEPAAIFIPTQAVLQAAVDTKLPLPAAGHITRTWDTAGCLLGREHAGTSGWLLATAWWDREIVDSRRRQHLRAV